ncbi:hypothetical protein FD724_06755 [Nostoc sp. C057]|nr:hypothetical protein FD724_06755 [Nostoc sp. C057]
MGLNTNHQGQEGLSTWEKDGFTLCCLMTRDMIPTSLKESEIELPSLEKLENEINYEKSLVEIHQKI